MTPIYKILSALLIIVLYSCGNSNQQITNAKDYEPYFVSEENEMLQLATADLKFWEKKLEKEPNQFPYLAKIAASQSLIFSTTGDINALIEAEKQLVKANEITDYNTPGYLCALARNYISQHKFKQALELLKKAETNGENLRATQKMLFDVHLELGNFDVAKTYLETIRKANDFDYLIRLSKWSDHRGNLDAAIKYMEQAKAIAEASNISGTKQWVYTNLADYYGHAGRINDSYAHYLKALELNPDDAYAKKGIAWIVYSHEKNPNEALRILEGINTKFNAPDYHLLKAEIADFKGDDVLKENELTSYYNAVKNPMYGDMYNKYNVLLFAEDDTASAKALKYAHIEVKNRPTPQSYDLLAWTYFNHGEVDDALDIMETHVIGKTHEPDVILHLAKIYKAKGMLKKVKELKKELEESTFELGPVTAKEIKNI
ncbi:cell surface protein [Tamlana nanhaiensis]|uniref:Cell surface protein n=1 Tax=Neotamlana nanhaiensis TaxID=1382798 RepID=A0A0D7W0I7_9FLAO|nr:tetratricopeptide repeat protein [Tamlana nanhaiensis]KJD32061.1 cell surface protein [Tamlana nanhaiensis]KJD32223.1 cell surface protein [Tamlana nanhaiensis]